MKITIFYITHPDKETANSIAKKCIQASLAACANIFPIESYYVWENKFQEDQEFVSILKTTPKKSSKLEQFIQSIHPYDVPCIIQYPSKVNDKYGEWIASCVNTTDQK